MDPPAFVTEMARQTFSPDGLNQGLHARYVATNLAYRKRSSDGRHKPTTPRSPPPLPASLLIHRVAAS